VAASIRFGGGIAGVELQQVKMKTTNRAVKTGKVIY
jgi:hypothetical protein